MWYLYSLEANKCKWIQKRVPCWMTLVDPSFRVTLLGYLHLDFQRKWWWYRKFDNEFLWTFYQVMVPSSLLAIILASILSFDRACGIQKASFTRILREPVMYRSAGLLLSFPRFKRSLTQRMSIYLYRLRVQLVGCLGYRMTYPGSWVFERVAGRKSFSFVIHPNDFVFSCVLTLALFYDLLETGISVSR